MKAIKMSDGIYRVGANIKTGDLFEGMWPIPDGVSLNAYVLKGDKTALIDLVRDCAVPLRRSGISYPLFPFLSKISIIL